MKKYLIPISMAVFIAACSGNSNSSNSNGTDETSATAAPATTDITENPDYQKGLALIAKNDCLTCHKVDEKVTGPAYRDVANKYDNTEANIKMLADAVIKGHSGTWGTVAMTPHPTVSQADAEQMVKYILLLRNK